MVVLLLVLIKKPDTFVSGFCFAPPIGESYNFNEMVIYLTIRKTMF